MDHRRLIGYELRLQTVTVTFRTVHRHLVGVLCDPSRAVLGFTDITSVQVAHVGGELPRTKRGRAHRHLLLSVTSPCLADACALLRRVRLTDIRSCRSLKPARGAQLLLLARRRGLTDIYSCRSLHRPRASPPRAPLLGFTDIYSCRSLYSTHTRSWSRSCPWAHRHLLSVTSRASIGSVRSSWHESHRHLLLSVTSPSSKLGRPSHP